MRLPTVRSILPALACVVVACGTSDGTGGNDTTPDTTIDVGGGDGGTDAGVDTSSDAGPAPCEENGDCRGGEVCRDGACREACGDDDPCTGAAPLCDPVTQSCVECLTTSDCERGTCESGFCVFDRCESDDDCEDGLPCDTATGICGPCGDDGDCPGGFTCEAGACAPIDERICTPEATRCDGNTLLTCSRDGTRETETPCGDDAVCTGADGDAECAEVVCEPDAIGCIDDATAFVCDPTGTAREPLPCRADQYCDAGACLVRVCEPDTTTCEGDFLVECDARGATRTTTACATFEACAAAELGCACVTDACEVRTCVPGTGRCVGALVQRCLDPGLRYASPTECDAEQSCLAGECVPDTCTPGETRCGGDTLLRCSEGSRWVPTDCTTSAQLCTTDAGGRSACSDRLCEPSTAFCLDIRTVGLCDARGAVISPTSCSVGEFCVGGSCAEVECDPRTCAEYGTGESRTDTDSDGIVDCVEGLADTDSDDSPDCADDDSDGDGIPDLTEGDGDLDRDGQPNYLDLDTDGDTIGDAIEGTVNTDGSGEPDYRDTDSDGDGWSDLAEAGREDIAAPAADTDADRTPDFRDLDSDNDGLDDAEETGCPDGSERLLVDSDDDSWDDGVERLVGSDRCDRSSTPEDLADLVWRPATSGAVEEFNVTISMPVMRRDIVANVDTTGSMGTMITAVRTRFPPDVMTASATLHPDVRWGVSRFDDFVCTGMGSTGDVIFRLLQRVTSSVTSVNTALTSLTAAGGGDYPESGFEALYQIATGAGISACGYTVPPFDPSANRIERVADGTVGGVGFRENALPVIFHVADAISRDGSAVGAAAATQAEMLEALQDIGARVMTLTSTVSGFSSELRAQMEPVAVATGTVVPACAWGTGAITRPSGCTTGQCCTGVAGASVSPVDGVCPLVFDTDGSNGGVAYALRTGQEALARFMRYTASTRVVGDASTPDFDTASIVTRVTALSSTAPAACGVSPSATDTNADAVNDAFLNTATGAGLTWRLRLRNTAPAAGAWVVRVEVLADDVAFVDAIDVLVITR